MSFRKDFILQRKKAYKEGYYEILIEETQEKGKYRVSFGDGVYPGLEDKEDRIFYLDSEGLLKFIYQRLNEEYKNGNNWELYNI